MPNSWKQNLPDLNPGDPELIALIRNRVSVLSRRVQRFIL